MSMLKKMFSVMWVTAKHKDLPSRLAPGGENDAWWNNQAADRGGIPIFGLLKERFAPLVDVKVCPLFKTDVREKFVAWLALMVEYEAIAEKVNAHASSMVHVREVAANLWKSIENSRQKWAAELLTGLRATNPFRRDVAEMDLDIALAYWLRSQPGSGKSLDESKVLSLSLARLILLSVRESELKEFVNSIAPEESKYSESEHEKELAERRELEKRVIELKSEMEKFNPASRFDESGRDLWVAFYFGLRYFNSRAAAPVDHVGRRIEGEFGVLALDALGLETGALGRNLFRPTDVPAWEGPLRTNVFHSLPPSA